MLTEMSIGGLSCSHGSPSIMLHTSTLEDSLTPFFFDTLTAALAARFRLLIRHCPTIAPQASCQPLRKQDANDGDDGAGAACCRAG